MNSPQRTILIVFAVIVAGTLLYPPFHIVGSEGFRRSEGYWWIFSPPMNGATVNLGLLLTQWIGVGVAAAIAFVLAGGANRNAQQDPAATATAPASTEVASSRVNDRHPQAVPIVRHIIRWTVLIASVVLVLGLNGLAGESLKQMGFGGFLSGAIRGALCILLLVWLWGATKRILGSRLDPIRGGAGQSVRGTAGSEPESHL